MPYLYMLMINSDERTDDINEYLKIIQKKDGLTFTSDAYLLAAFVSGPHGRCADLGAGTGIVSLLCAQKGKAQHIRAIELQSELADLILRNAKLNSLSDRIIPLNADVRTVDRADVGGALDAVFSNPPYFRAGSGIAARNRMLHDARFEENGGFADFAACASRLLCGGGSFYVVHRANRITDVLSGMRGAGIEPKRLILVCPDRRSPPNLLLCEGKKGAGEGLVIAPTLVMYRDDRSYTPELTRVYENCSLEFMFEGGAAK